MNGATIEPWTSVNKPPKISITIMIGANHSFLRIRRKAQSSFRNSIVTSQLKIDV